MSDEFTRDYKLIIFDKDGTLCRSRSGQTFINSADDQELIPGVLEKIKDLKTQGAKIAIASNQGGVAFGHMSYSEAWAIMEHAEDLIEADEFIFCPDHPKGTVPEYTSDSPYRKPGPKMITETADNLHVPLSGVLFVGDRPEDEQAAKAAGVDFMWAKDFFGWGE
jgi:D-glycero-D-manno-heptose 1,7-bisphosphate phosphatase